ncbi:MAG: glycosyltransferase family 4 protein [Lachnospiraceae bacterium]|nr:glycosyltransferase family 4 protein [Lachnospiraceae bacterium]
MRVLVVHNLHRTGSASGDDQVFRSEVQLLRSMGHKVAEYSVSNDDFDEKGFVGKAIMSAGMLWSVRHYLGIIQTIQKMRPHVMHVHTFFPLLSPSILYAARRMKVPVVATLHDTRFICPCATSIRDGKICNLCGDGRYFRMVRYGCFKKSRVESLIVSLIFSWHRFRKSFYRMIDEYICLNDSQIHLLKEIGFDGKRVTKKYNFVADPGTGGTEVRPPGLPERYVVFYGRIGEEKGIRVLMKAWEQLPDVPLVVMGGGPLEKEFVKWAEDKPNIYYLGYMEHSLCLACARNAAFVVMPSVWYEGCPMTAIEAESLGLPIVASNMGFFKEALEHGKNGLKFPVGNAAEMAKTVRALYEDPERCVRMGEEARADYEKKYTQENNIAQLMDVYRKAIRRNRVKQRARA